MRTIDAISVRMYRQGLGDCFLLSFFTRGKKTFTMLIDCGVLSKSKEHQLKMIEVANDIKKETNGQLDVLIATHEHWDHLSGFLQAKEVFDSIKIKEVWMSWIENPKDVLAKKIKANHRKKLTAIATAFEKIKNQAMSGLNEKQQTGKMRYLNAFKSFFNFYGPVGEYLSANKNSTNAALEYLRNRKGSETRYFTPKSNDTYERDELPGIRMYILGPPKDEKALRKMNPSKKNSEVYEMDYRFGYGNSFIDSMEENEKSNPFNSVKMLSRQEVEFVYPEYLDKKNEWRRIDDDWLMSAGNLAIALDSAVNNTSFAIAFEFIESGKVLLFPADAQVGNWLSWSNYEWSIKSGRGKETITMDDLFKRTVLYKVGHHGSHNATMKEHGLEKMTSPELIAMIPVDQKMAKGRNWKMPFKPLREELENKTNERVIIQDEAYPKKISKKNRPMRNSTDLYHEVVIQNK